eukprot:6551252-Prorocentrum_lima.AAC.1
MALWGLEQVASQRPPRFMALQGRDPGTRASRTPGGAVAARPFVQWGGTLLIAHPGRERPG